MRAPDLRAPSAKPLLHAAGVFTAIDGRDFWNFQYYFLDPAKETQDLDAREVLRADVAVLGRADEPDGRAVIEQT